MPSPLISSLITRCWLDDDGLHVWQSHRCGPRGTVTSMLPYPQWSAPDGVNVTPSINCLDCGLHAFAVVTAHTDPEEVSHG